MDSGLDHQIVDLKAASGEFSFQARIGGSAQHVWFRTDSPVTPSADAALAACLMPAMRNGGRLKMADPVSPRVLRTQREFQAIQQAWSLDWDFGDPPLREVEVEAPARAPEAPREKGRVAAFFSGGVDSWATVLGNPDVTDLIFVRGFDLIPGAAQHGRLADEVEGRLRDAAGELGLQLHVVDTNLRELSDKFVRWETYFGCAAAAIALLLAPGFERALIAGGSDHELQEAFGANRLVDQLWSTEQLEVVDAGGRFNRVERLQQIADNEVVQRTLRVCWENPAGAYNCGRCGKCLLTMAALEALGTRERIQTFPPALDLEAVAAVGSTRSVLLTFWEDVLDAAHAHDKPVLAGAVEAAVANGRRNLGLPEDHRSRTRPGPAPAATGPSQEIAKLHSAPGELSFEARIDGTARELWFRTETPVEPTADAALAACLMPAMRDGGTLTLAEPVSARLLRTQREFQAVQQAWSLDWDFGDPPLREVEVEAPARAQEPPGGSGRVAAFFSGGVDSWATVLGNPDVTDLIFVRGFDLIPGAAHQVELAGEVEARLREAAAALELPLHVVDTNLRELSDGVVPWEAYNATAMAAVALLFESLFERVLIASDTDHATQIPLGTGRMVDQLLGTERLELVDDGGRFNREQRLRRIADHPVVQRTLRVCWQNPDSAYNCGRCHKCMLTKVSLEAIGVRERVTSFSPGIDLGLLNTFKATHPIALALWEDTLDTTRAAGRVDLERAVEALLTRSKRERGLSATHRTRTTAGPAASVRTAVVIPAWRQPQFLAAAVKSALEQEGAGVVIVNDGCPYPSADRIGQALRDANPDRVAYLHQPNRGLSAARNAGVHHAFARWPQLQGVFPLDADNMLSLGTLAELWATLEEHPEADWATPVLEFFGAEDGEWQVPGPYLPYRQLFSNQCDAGSLIRRSVFEAGIEFDETMREGFEDWEFFLHATLAGFRGVKAGHCGFRYRRRPHSMLVTSLQRAERIEAGLHRRHRDAYRATALVRAEHAEAPRFALVRCDREDVLLSAACDLEPHRLPLGEFLRGESAPASEPSLAGLHIPAVTVLISAGALEWLQARRLLPGLLLRLQAELRRRTSVGVRVRPASTAGVELTALALRTGTLPRLASVDAGLKAEATIEIDGDGDAPPPLLSTAAAWAAIASIGPAAHQRRRLAPEASHADFFEERHLDLLETTVPWSGAEGGRVLLALAPRAGEDRAQRDLFALAEAMRAAAPSLTAHLLLTASTGFGAESPPGPFDTVTALGGLDSEATTMLLERLAGDADVVIHAGSSEGYHVLPRIPADRRGAQVVLAAGATEGPAGGHDVLATRQYEPLVDLYLAPSPLVAHRLVNRSAVPDKIVLVEAEADADWTAAGRAVLETIESVDSERRRPTAEALAA